MIDADGAGPPSNFTMVMQWVRKLLEQKTNTFSLRFKFSVVDPHQCCNLKKKDSDHNNCSQTERSGNLRKAFERSLAHTT